MATIYLPDGGSYDDGQPDEDELLRLLQQQQQQAAAADRSAPQQGTRGTEEPTFGTNPPETQAPQLTTPANTSATEQDLLRAFRQSADAQRMYENQTDTSVLGDPRFQTFAQTGRYTPSGDAWPDAEHAGANVGAPAGANDPRLMPSARATPVASQAPTIPAQQHDVPVQQHDVFSDALTRQLEQIAQAQLASYQNQQAQLQQFLNPLVQSQQQLIQQQQQQYAAQQQAMEQAAAAAAQRRAATGTEVDRLTGFLNERMNKLRGPAYTGTEAEVLRTQLLDPLERDRQAALKRATEQISSRGYELDSGVAQELLERVNRAFDEQRTSAQGGLAQRQIEEQRSREQEAQQLMQYLTALPDATARGDLEYVSYVQNLLNQPRQASLATGMAGGTGIAQLLDLIQQPGMQAVSMADLLAEIPSRRLNDALATLGIGGTPGSQTSSLIQLLQQQQQQRQYQNQQAAQYWSQIGQSFRP